MADKKKTREEPFKGEPQTPEEARTVAAAGRLLAEGMVVDEGDARLLEWLQRHPDDLSRMQLKWVSDLVARNGRRYVNREKEACRA
jgi:hypothetical protein